MTIDISQFHQVFFEESFEGLEAMENALLDLSQGVDDPELIHLIFRSAHSIKGGSGTFGFTAVASFTHVMETLLDQMREGEREITKDALNLLMESGDVLRDMLEAARDGGDFDAEHAASIQANLETMLGASTDVEADTNESAESSSGIAGWKIDFKPYVDLLKTGNDPVRMFRELAEMGDLQVEVITDAVPAFAGFDPEECHLSWKLQLDGAVEREHLDEIFEWVDGDCDLSIEPIAATESSEQDSAQATTTDDEPVKAAAPANDRREGDRRKADRRSSGNADSSIRVSIQKIDELINMVGELVITQSMLGQIGSGEIDEFDAARLEKLRDGLQQLERNTREMQESVMQIRMLPISFSFNRFPRLVHDMSSKLGKKIELKISGEGTELDKTVMEKIGDPLVHLIRNSLDHGIEMPEDRVARGKSETGIIELNAFHQGGNIVIEIKDDGNGLPADKILAKARERGLVGEHEKLTRERTLELIFEPGFSTADVVTDVSGRGVGMDVVRRNIKDLGGAIEVQSTPGEGSTFTIRLPLTLAILDGQLLNVGDETFVMPLISIVESLQVDTGLVNSVAGSAEMYKLREDYIPIVRLYEVFGIEPKTTTLEEALLVVVEHEGQKIGLMVDELLGQQQVVIKSLETNYRRIVGISGATILGDGTVALILDVGGLISLSGGGKGLRRPANDEQAA
ncbi:Signal transduction histidine kinase CheA [hydrothermal vent metagenome]|uniref:Chemotaxis protein CheA n=1 Tax=hydrothermal vent metagenome TaxID=652676 RepID=A0A3B0YHG2_9ZZZZ